MKLLKHYKYQVPRVTHMSLETEGIFCGSVRFNGELEELENMNIGIDETVVHTADDPYFIEN